MFEGIEDSRILKMSDQEKRWLNNIKKALYESDKAYSGGNAADHCFEQLCKAVDTAKTLRRSLRGEDTSSKENKKRFMEFLDCEVPTAERGGLNFPLIDARQGTPVNYTFSGLIYAIRCMVHENENLNAAEQPDYHVLIDWSQPNKDHIAELVNGQLVINGHFFWIRLRQVLAKWITRIQLVIDVSAGRSWSTHIDVPLMSILPESEDQSRKTGS
jgi:hypothetical protein